VRFKRPFVLAAAMLAGTGNAYADQPKTSVVSVRYVVTEQLPERLETTLLNPLERTLVALPRVSNVRSVAGHGYVNLEIEFEGGATEPDLATVSNRIDGLVLDSKVVVTSRTVLLASPRL